MRALAEDYMSALSNETGNAGNIADAIYPAGSHALGVACTLCCFPPHGRFRDHGILW